MAVGTAIASSGSGQFWAPDRLLAGFIILTPLLWAAGLITPLALLLALILLCRVPLHVILHDRIFWAWCLVGLMQLVSVIKNCAALGSTLTCVPRWSISTVVLGWFVLATALLVGRHFRMATPRLTRAFCVLGLYFAILSVVCLALYYGLGWRILNIPSPIALLLPQSLPAVKFQFTMQFFGSDRVFGMVVPRLALFYPWSVVLSFVGLATVCIALQDLSRFWRSLGVGGGLLVVVLSWSRVGFVLCLISLLVYAWARVHVGYRWLAGFAVVGFCALAVALDPTLVGFMQDLYDRFTAARPGSSMARTLVYEMTWNEVVKAPILGYGWPGPYVHPNIPAPIGSHSTFLGVLYTGGVLMLVPLLAAFVGMLVAGYRAAVRGGVRERAGFVVLVSLAIFSVGESIYTFVLPCLPVFVWLGACRAPPNYLAGETSGGR